MTGRTEGGMHASGGDGGKRTWILAGVAALVIGLLVLELTTGEGGAAGAAPRAGDAASSAALTSQVEVPVGSPAGADLVALRARYQPVLIARPFTTRSFAPPPPPRRDAPAAPTARSAPPPPEPIRLRFTGLLGSGEDRSAVLEERGTGQGFVAAPGLRLGEYAVAAVSTKAVVLKRGDTERSLALGEVLELPVSLRPALARLRPASAAPAGAGAAAGAAGAPALSEERIQSIAERLRARRQASLTPTTEEAN